MRTLIFGAGYSGRAFARLVSGEAGFIAGTTRSEENFIRLAASGMTPLTFDGAGSISRELADALRTTTHLVVSVGPDEAGDPVLRSLGENLLGAMPALAWTGYLSTVGVYGDHDGAWVDETSECRPASRRSVARLAAENAWRDAAGKAGVPLAILRLSGIYGPGRNAFVNLAEGKARRIVKTGQVFNRIHVEDIAGTLRHLSSAGIAGTFNVSDDEPAPPQDVVEYAARVMGIDPPPEIAFEEAELGPMARSFYGETKRVSNEKLKASGYRMRHPNYRTELEAMWRDGNWRAEPGGGL